MTLLELLIALGLTLALLGSLFAFFHNTIRSREDMLALTAKHRAAAVLIDRIENDLTFCIAGDSRHGAGVSGGATQLRILTRGVAAHLAERGTGDGAAFSDLQIAEYRFSTGSGLRARRETAAAQPTAEAVDSGPTQTSHRGFEPIADDLHRVRFRYHDGNDWRNAYDSQEEGRLPIAVEVAIWFDEWPDSYADEDEPLDDELEREESADRERMTFDPTGTFDEVAWARRADRDPTFREPPPDRLRVFTILDAREDDS